MLAINRASSNASLSNVAAATCSTAHASDNTLKFIWDSGNHGQVKVYRVAPLNADDKTSAVSPITISEKDFREGFGTPTRKSPNIFLFTQKIRPGIYVTLNRYPN